MQLLSHAQAALVRNWRIVLLYMVGSIAVITAYSLAMEAMIDVVPKETSPKPIWYVFSSLILDLALVGLVSACQAVAFAFLGEEMDRPLWKFGGWKESLKRFFVYWLILNLLFVTSSKIPISMPDSMQMEVGLLMWAFRFSLTVLGIPIGACIVFGGGLRWREVPSMVAPFFQLFPMAFAAVALGFLQGLLIDIASGMLYGVENSVWMWSLVNVPLVFLECLAFAVMWLVCMHYRDIAEEFGDDDFDF